VLGFENAVAVTAVSPSLAPVELADARALAAERGWRHVEISTNELEREQYRANGPDRCYHCRSELFDVLGSLATAVGVRCVAVGINLDDASDYRPGQRAARERGVRAPLLDAGLTKAEIRELSRARGLRSWDKPAAACLSSRIAYGIEVTPERLDRIARSEEAVRRLGVREVRVRDHGDLARIEVPLSDIERIAAQHQELAASLRELGFNYVTLDLEGFRSGSMNIPLLKVQRLSSSSGGVGVARNRAARPAPSQE